MDRRGILKVAMGGSAVTADGPAKPRLARAADTHVPRFLPRANPVHLDPIWMAKYGACNGFRLISDMPSGVNDNVEPRMWMVEAREASPDRAVDELAVVGSDKSAMDDVVCVPTGFSQRSHAWRKNLTGIVKAPFPVPWDVKKA